MMVATGMYIVDLPEVDQNWKMVRNMTISADI
jgi:hypothetical protein